MEVNYMHLFYRSFITFVFSMFLFSFAFDVNAQSIEELEEENQELRDEVEFLLETIEELEDQIAELEEMLSELVDDEDVSDSDAARDGYGIGDDVEVDGVLIRVEDAYYTDERNSISDRQADQVIMIEIYYENNTGEDYSPAFDFELYFDGTRAESYPVGDIILSSVSDGRNATGTIAYAIMGEPEVVELEYTPLFNIFSSEEATIIDVTPE